MKRSTQACRPTPERMRAYTRLINVMAGHIGHEQGIGAEQLARQIGVDQRKLRQLISTARTQGLALCGTPGTGYYVAQTGAELDEACTFLRKRALHSLRLLSVMRRVSMPTLMGQLLLAQG